MRTRALISRKVRHRDRLDKAWPGQWLLELPWRRATAEQDQARNQNHQKTFHRSASPLLIACFTGALLATEASGQNIKPIAPVRSPPGNPIPGGEIIPLNLAEAVSLGLRDNRSIKSAYLNRVAQKFDLFVAENLFLPKITLTANVDSSRSGGITRNDSTVSVGAGWLTPLGTRAIFSWDRNDPLDRNRDGHTERAGLSVIQPLLRGAGFDVNLAPIRLARLQEEINHLSLRSTVSDTVTTIITSYRRLLQAQEQVHLAELSLQRTRDLLETNRALIAAGRMAAADIVQTESGVANQEVAVWQSRQQKVSAQLALLQLLAVDPRTNIVAAESIKAERVPIDLDRVIDLGFASRMDILAQGKALEQTRMDVMLAKNNRLWDLSVTGSISRRQDTDPLLGNIDRPVDHNVGLQLNIPIGDYAPRAREINATIGLRTAELRYQDLSQSVEAQIRDAVQTVETSWLQLEAARRAKSLAARALELQQEKLKAGRASNFEVLSFQTDLRTADTQELSAGISYLNALTSLDQQIGNTLETWRIALND